MNFRDLTKIDNLTARISKYKKTIYSILIFIILISVFINIWFLWKLFKVQKDFKELKTYLIDLATLAGVENYGSAHIHADFKMYINGKEVNLYKKENFEKNKFVHFHPTNDPNKPNENVIHVHAVGITLGQFLRTVGVVFNEGCLVIEGRKYCEEGVKKLKVYVNGKLITNYENYTIKDLDKILISFGSENEVEIKNQLKSIGDNAKKHSGPLNFKCDSDC